MNILSILFISLFIYSTFAGTCSVGFSYSLRAQYTSNGVVNDIYDLTFSNTGSCSVIGAQIKIGNPNLALLQSWGIDRALNRSVFSISNWPNLQQGQTYTSSGFISTGGAPQLSLKWTPCDPSCIPPPSCSELGCECDEICIADGGLPRCAQVGSNLCSHPSTSGSSVSGSTTGYFSTTTGGLNNIHSTTTSHPSSTTSTNHRCGTVSISQTLSSSWDGGSQWNAVITNIGTTIITNVEIVAGSSAISSLWPLDNKGSGKYALPSYVAPLASGNSITFSYNVAQTTKVSFSIASITCSGTSQQATCSSFNGTSCPARCMKVVGDPYCAPRKTFCVDRPLSTCSSTPTCGHNPNTDEILEFPSACMPSTFNTFDPKVPTCADGTLKCGEFQVCVDGYLNHSCYGKCRPLSEGHCYNIVH